ncbi:MAG: RNA polymerase factor sigma-54 [Pseudomonadota bacterium]
MTLKMKLQQKQTQSLVMTQSLAQSIKLLQLSHVELLDFVKEEVEKNPLLELGTEEANAHLPHTNPSDVISDKQTEDGEIRSGVETPSVEPSAEQQPEIDLRNVYDTGTAGAEKQDLNQQQADYSTLSGPSSGAATVEDFDQLANLEGNTSLVDHLEHQIALQFKNPEERLLATEIAHGLDEDGYFREPVDAFAARNKTSADMVYWVLERFQSLEPVGIGARNLAECLAMQLMDQDRFDPAMRKLIENLDLLAKREFSALMKLCSVDREDFSEMLEEIRALDPRPARGYEPVLAELVVPDVLISQSHLGDWNIELNPETLPKVLVNHEYHAQLSGSLDEKDNAFITDCLESANWLTKSLDQRAQTILKVAIEIVKKQDRFFAEGVQFLQPMKLKDVADSIKMHESTVSRVTANKYLHCERGTFELKYFFSSSIASSDGETQYSAEAVKFQIRKMVEAEQSNKILSDGQIAENLQAVGISIARRTVAKYREAMHISSSAQRRREKSVVG